MNNSNPWESLLRSWTPRTPSAGLKKRLFPASTAEPDHAVATLNHRWHWLAPALACLMFLSVTFNNRPYRIAYLATSDTNLLLGSFITNRIPPAYLMADFHSERNGPQVDTFEWTNERQITSSMRSFPLTKTNSLIH